MNAFQWAGSIAAAWFLVGAAIAVPVGRLLSRQCDAEEAAEG